MSTLLNSAGNMRHVRSLLLFTILTVESVQANAKLIVPVIFCDNMILQRQKPIAVWGKADAYEDVAITLNNKTTKCISDADGNWRTNLPKMNAGGPYTMAITTNGNEKITINDILIGEVWLCAGQSNMNFILAGDRNAVTELHADNKNVREFRCDMPQGALNPENSEHSRWITAVGYDDKKQFSAVAYYFAKKLQDELNVPVGVIIMSCGATRAESWTNPELLKADTILKPLLSYWAKNANDPKALINNILGKFYDDVVKPVAPFTARGLIWYQGESNTLPDYSGRTITERASEYKPLLHDVINSYRLAWQNKNLPVCIVQLPNYKDPSGDIQWAKIRQAQLQVVNETPNTGLVITIDVGDSTNIHPNNKQPVGERLALWALVNQYNIKDLIVSGPIVSGFQVIDAKAVINFKYVADGFMVKNAATLTGFEIADASSPNIFIAASAVIDNNSVIVFSPKVENPVAVRYAWSDNPLATLFNNMGLPAGPFLLTLNSSNKTN
jgi:sialate O-acetylesterase